MNGTITEAYEVPDEFALDEAELAGLPASAITEAEAVAAWTVPWPAARSTAEPAILPYADRGAASL